MAQKMSKNCVQCNTTVSFEVQDADYAAYRQGEFVQNAFPYLSPDIREMLISGVCGKCFDDLCAPIEDECEDCGLYIEECVCEDNLNIPSF